VRRGEVYRIIARSVAMVASDRLLRSWAEGLIDKIEARIAERGHTVDRD
jgi:farnesyl-diphosphate farnesyltransferase